MEYILEDVLQPACTTSRETWKHWLYQLASETEIYFKVETFFAHLGFLLCNQIIFTLQLKKKQLHRKQKQIKEMLHFIEEKNPVIVKI